jgi:hypothetical protein
MYSVCTVVYGTGMVAGIVLVQCGTVDYSTFLVSKLGNFTYRIGHFFTAYNVCSVYQAKKALSIVYTPSTALHEAH